MMAKLPAFQFYPGDWMKDPALRSCSLAARGLWIDMICMMHESPRRGYLMHVTGIPLTEGELARIAGCTQKDTRARLMELGRAGVYSMTDDGVIYSRRVVRDEDRRRRCSDNGRKGGNPALVGKSDKPRDNPTDNQTANPKPTPSSSSSFSSSTSPSGDTPQPPYSTFGNPDGGPSFLDFWYAYPAHRRKRQGDAIAVWAELRREGIDPAAIMAGVTAYAASDVGKGKFTLEPANWLNGRCWLDDPLSWADEPNKTDKNEADRKAKAERIARMVEERR